MKNLFITLLTLVSCVFYSQEIAQINGVFTTNSGIPLEGKFQNFYESGNVMFSYEILDGLHNGKFSSFYDNGKLKQKGSYLNGEKVGSWLSWSENGVLISKTGFDNHGNRDGEWIVWNKEGDYSAVVLYESGKRISNWKIVTKNGQIAQTSSN